MKTLYALVIIWLGFFGLVGWLATVDIDAAMGVFVISILILGMITAMAVLEGNKS